MKQKLLLLITLLISISSFSQKIIFKEKVFQPNDIVNLFANDVKLRAEPNTTSEVLALMRMGSQLIFLEKTNQEYVTDNVKSDWVKVQYANQVGYIVQKFIAVEKVTLNGEPYYLNVEFDAKRKKYNILIRKMNLHAEIVENERILVPEDFDSLEIAFSDDDRELDIIKDIIEVVYKKGEKKVTTYIFSGPVYLHKIPSLIEDKKLTKDKKEEIITTQKIQFPDEVEHYEGSFIYYTESIVRKNLENSNLKEIIEQYSVRMKWGENGLQPTFEYVKNNIEESKKR
ncbi:SH3 domain-containing protein [Aureivirga marina]|uniref:SH3 domain-containing protein n=1 Tax=Aureivirga marina TaxID=1182451 RepID=UPI0018CBEE33|nr:SH3 domain-containing protein [Aureivirga marina]